MQLIDKLKLEKKINTTSFLNTIQTSEINTLSSTIDQDKQLETIISKYLNLKRKINILLSKND